MKTAQLKSIMTPRRLLALIGHTLLWLYVALSFPLLAWLNWQPDNDSLSTTSPGSFMVLVDGEEGVASVDYCAYGVTWYESDWLGFDVRKPLVKDGHLLTCRVVPRVDYYNHRVDLAEEPGHL